MVLTAKLESSARRLFPNLKPEQALAELLLERAQKNLIKYQTLARQFQIKYNMDFDTLREIVTTGTPSAVLEQDYFDWELAVTGITGMEMEIKRLKKASDGS